MKKNLLLLVPVLLFACSKDYTEDINTINGRLDKLEQALPTIEEQIESINTQLVSLKKNDDEIKTQIVELEKKDLATAVEIADLKAKDSALEKSISDLQKYVDTQIVNSKSEADAAYATIEQYNNIKSQLSALQSSTDKLGEDLTAKINTEIKSLTDRISDLENRLKAIEEKVESLLARIQSVSYIPTYSDGKAIVKYADDVSRVTLDFEVSPKDAVVELAKVWQSAISVKAVYTQTRAVSFVDMPIVGFEADTENGIISIVASGENLSEEFFVGIQEASCRLAISDGNNSVTSEYIPLVGASDDLKLVISADKSCIYNNGEDVVTFSLTCNGVSITNGYTIYDQNDMPIAGNTFSSTQIGTYRFWAVYGSAVTNVDTVINVVATPPAAPAVPTDNNPTKTNFVRRVLITQFTGTSCVYSPEMVNALHAVVSSPVYSSKFVLAAAHLYNSTDPAYLNDAKTLNTSVGVYSFPTINADMWQNHENRNPDSVAALITSALNRTIVKGGIAVNAKYYENEKYVTVSCLVKAKESENFRVGAWLLEDNIWGQQANNGYTAVDGVNFNNHNNCIRIANQSRQSSVDYTGLTLGYIEAGETKTKEFAFPLQTSWKTDNLRLVLFISTQEGDKWYVNNVVEAPINGVVDFEYTK